MEYKSNICDLYACKALHYSHDDVTSNNIIMKFENVGNVTTKGKLYLNALSSSVILETSSCELSSDCYCCDILCIVQNEPLIISVIYKNMKVIEMNNQRLTLLNN